MNGEWTFANLEGEWIHETFPTKEEAIREGKLTLEGNFVIGQLFDHHKEEYCMIENIQEISQ